MMRDAYIDRLYKQVMQHVPISRAAYGNSLYGWSIDPVLIGGNEVGLVLMRGTELHLQLDKSEALRHARRIIRQEVAPRLAQHGHLTTRAMEGSADIRFLARLGFYKVGMDGKLAIYKLDELKIK